MLFDEWTQECLMHYGTLQGLFVALIDISIAETWSYPKHVILWAVV